MAQDIVLTQEGYDELKEKLRVLKSEGRSDIAEKLKVARSFGDLSENSEYEAAKNEQSILEGRIKEVTNMLNHAEIIDNGAIAEDEVAIGKTVTFQEEDDEPETYQIVGAAESDPFNGKISNESPIAKGLIGHKVGETVTVETPGGDMQVKIISVEK